MVCNNQQMRAARSVEIEEPREILTSYLSSFLSISKLSNLHFFRFIMASRSKNTAGLALVSCLLLLVSVVSSVNSDEYRNILDPTLFGFGSGLACELAKCLRGQCVNTTSLPFYKCECNSGWKSPFGASWLPCILPNCSIDLSCANSSNQNPAPPPVVPPFGGAFDICSLHVCGNGQCIANNTAGNSTDSYTCDCDAGYLNLMNKSNGYCIHKCSIGADCANVNLPLGRGTHPPPPPPLQPPPGSSSQSSSYQGPRELQKLILTTAAASLATWAAFGVGASIDGALSR